MSTSNPLRLDAALVRQAKATARLQKRTLPRQIEYWAELGRAIESMLSQEQLLAVREGLAKLVVDHISSAPVSSDEVFADVEQFRNDESSPAQVTRAKVRYQRSESHPGFLEQIATDGTRKVGEFKDGLFVPVES